jgi:mercuric ion transport protein
MAMQVGAPIEDRAAPSARSSGALAAFGVAGGVATLLASSCCIVPAVLGGVGISAGFLVFLQSLAPWRTPFLILSTVGVAGGWLLWWRSRRVACTSSATCATPRGSHVTAALLVAATKLIAIAAVWSYFEPTLLAALQGE